jgi:hypothetical protein
MRGEGWDGGGHRGPFPPHLNPPPPWGEEVIFLTQLGLNFKPYQPDKPTNQINQIVVFEPTFPKSLHMNFKWHFSIVFLTIFNKYGIKLKGILIKSHREIFPLVWNEEVL